MSAAAEKNAPAASSRRVIVHMGVQKTGSTSLHDYLEGNKAALQDHLQVLTPERGSATRLMGRAAVFFSLDPSDEAGLRAGFAETIEGVRAQIPDAPGATLISHENLPGAMLGRAGTVTLYPQLEEIIATLDAHLAPHRPEYVIYTRDLAAWKRSAHNQAVRSDGYTADFATFRAETARCGDWDGVAARLGAAAPGRSHVLRLEDEPDRDRPGTQLLRLAGLEDGVINGLAPQTLRRNTSLNAGSLELMRRINTLELRPKQRRQIAYLIDRNQRLFNDSPAAADTPRRPA